MIPRLTKRRKPDDREGRDARGFEQKLGLHSLDDFQERKMSLETDEQSPRPSVIEVNRVVATLGDRINQRLAAKEAEATAPKVQHPWQAIYKIEQPNIIEFCDKWLRQPLYEGPQTEFALAVCGTDPLTWRGHSPFQRAYALWGKRGGKDATFAKISTYMCMKLVNMIDPWKFFGLSDGTPIACINVSYNATQAREVFFKYLKSYMRRTKNPYTGKNFFEQMGLDIKEGGKCFQSRKVVLADRKSSDGEDLLCFYSGDSREFTGEGKNILLALLDELGAFPSVVKALGLHDALLETAVATFGENAFMGAASYVYKKNDAMVTAYEQAADGAKEGYIYRSTYPTWIANPRVNREQLERLRKKNPQRFARVYECKLEDEDNQFIKPSAEVRGQMNMARENPIHGNLSWTNDITVDFKAKTCGIPFKEFFRGLPGKQYWIHYDLATGKDGRDKVGLGMSSRYRDRARYSKLFLEALAKEGRPVPPERESLEDGIWIDLMLQIRSIAGREVSFAGLLDLAVYLRDVLEFDIVGLSYDGWDSTGEVQRAKEKGFNCVVLSMDRTNEPAERTKELMYKGLLNYYGNQVFLREAEELVYDNKGKVDHPESSNLREQQEGDRRGSKDVWDGVCGTVQGLMGATESGDAQGDVDEAGWAAL